MIAIINNLSVLIMIFISGIAMSIILAFLLLKLIRQDTKNAIRIIGAWILIYPLLFLFIPMISEAIWMRFFLRAPISGTIKAVISYPFFHSPGIINQCLTPIFPIELFFYFLWLAYFISGIGLLKFKKWARVLGIYASEITVIFSFGLWLYNGICMDALISTGIFSVARPAFKNFNSLSSLFENILPIGLPGLIFWILLTGKEVKAQFIGKQ